MSRNFKGALQILLKEHTIMYHTQSVKAGEAIKVYPAVDNRLTLTASLMQAANVDGGWRLSVISQKVENGQFIYAACNLIAYPQEGSAWDLL